MSGDHANMDQWSPAKKAESLQNLAKGPLSSSLTNLSSSSRAIPSDKDFHFFNNFDEFKLPIQEIAKKSQSFLESIGSSAQIWGKPIPFPKDMEGDEGYDWVSNVNDEIYERFDVSMDEFERIRKKEEEIGRPLGPAADTENGFQMVYGKKKKGTSYSVSGVLSESTSGKEELSGVRVAARDKNASAMRKAKIPFHIPTIRRPQEEYNILVNNANLPFEHVWLQRSEDGLRFIHPLEKHSVLEFVDKYLGDVEPSKPPSMENTPFKLVEEVKDLKELAAKLRSAHEFAVDLEHNQYRSFQGLTCLMQISTRTEDFVVDTLKLRVHVGPYLREIFKDPTKKKVMHGADRDIVWLQRDFGIYVCNLFDTGQASRVLKLERNSLEFLLQHFCGVTANKEYQNADWRLRPLPDEMLRYAREDTHYLLYIYDIMKIKLHSMPKNSGDSDAPLVEVYKRSYDICMQLYEKELLTENSYLYIYGLQNAGFNAQQLAIVAGLCDWRDAVARAEDESTGYILPNKTLLEIGKQMPITASKLRRLVKSKHLYVERNLASVVSIIRQSMQNAAAFEPIVQYLKEARAETVLEVNLEAGDASEVIPSVTPTPVQTATEGIGGGTSTNSIMTTHLWGSPHVKEKSLQLGSGVVQAHPFGQGGSSELPGANGRVKMESSCYKSDVPSESSFTVSGQSTKETATITGLSSSAKVSVATVHVSTKPSRGFGALLGNSAPKRKFGTDKNEKEEIKLEQIISSVSLPFHSFSGRDSQMKAVLEEPSRVLEIPQLAEPPEPSSDSKLEDVILLEDNSNAEESGNCKSETPHVAREDKSVGSLEMDEGDEPMSLSDLSTSFQKCFQSLNQNRKAAKPDKAQEPSGLLQLKPFDYEAARKQIKFRVAQDEGSGVRDGEQELLDSGSRKKNAGVGQAQKGDGTREFGQGRRRQAFPASGNRSATFL